MNRDHAGCHHYRWRYYRMCHRLQPCQAGCETVTYRQSNKRRNRGFVGRRRHFNLSRLDTRTVSDALPCKSGTLSDVGGGTPHRNPDRYRIHSVWHTISIFQSSGSSRTYRPCRPACETRLFSGSLNIRTGVAVRASTFKSIAGAVLFPEDAQVRNPKMVTALAKGAVKLGARFLFGNPVTRFVKADERVIGVVVNGETLYADTLVIAAGCWAGRCLTNSAFRYKSNL